MKKYLNIPKNILICQRGQSVFITYKNGNKIAKEVTWEDFIKSGNITEPDNKPLSGFKLKECKGGYAADWYSYGCAPYAVITDPRGFDISITLNNLTWIMHQYTHDVNNGFIGDFVYGWDGAQLMLVPTVSEDYKYTKTVDDELKNYKLKDCVVGETYKFPNDTAMIYLGYLPIIHNAISGDYDDMKVVFSKKKYHCFKKLNDTWKPYETISSTKKFLIKVNDYIYTVEQVEKFIKEMYMYFWDNVNIEDPDVVRIEPNDELISKNEQRLNQIKKFIETPYKQWKTKYNIWDNNCTCELGIYVFNKERTEVFKYFMGCVATVNGLRMSDYASKRRAQVAKEKGVFIYDLKLDPFEEEFGNNAIKNITCYAPYKFKLVGNNIIQKEQIINPPTILLSDLLEKESETIYITKSYCDNLNKCVKLVNKSGFEFTIGDSYNT